MVINAYAMDSNQACFSLIGAFPPVKNLLYGGSFEARVMSAAALWILGNGIILNTQSRV
jgi:hypothetical protein